MITLPTRLHPALVAWALVPSGWAALDILAATAAHFGWSDWLKAVGWWVCRFLSNQEAHE